MKTPPPNQTGKPLFFWITIACGLFVAIAIACTASLFWRYGTVQHVTGWNYFRKGSGWYIESVDRKGPAAMAVRTGDRIVAIDRNTQVEQAGPFAALRPLNPGDTYSMEIERGGGRSHVRLAMEAASRQPKTWLWCSFLLAAIGFFVAGLLAGITRPGDRLTRICTLAAMAWALQMLNAPLDDLYRPRSGLADSFYFQAHGWEFWICLLIDVFARPWYLVLTFDFLSSFPADAPPGRLRTALRRAVYGYGIVTTAWTLPVTVAFMAGDRYALQVLSRFPRFFSLAGDFGINFQMVNPLLAVALVAAVASNYCRVTGVRIVARRGIHLLLRTNVLRAAAWIPACALATIIVLDPHRAVGDFLLRNTGSLLLIGTAAAGLTYRVQLGQWIDRRFFRATYEEEQGLLKLIDEIKAQDSVEAILMLVHGQVEAALCPSRVVRFARQRQTGDMILGYSTAEGGCTLIPRDSELLHALAQCDRPRDFPFTAGELTASGGYWLEQLGITLIVPVTADGCDLHGLILLGEKKSGEPYSAADRKLLQAVAERMAILYEDAAHPAARQVNLMKECPACGCCYDGSNMACAIDGEELTLSVPLPVERVVDGRYQLEWRLRNGTTGAVYSAVDLRLKRPVAVKVMLSSRLGNRAALTRFEREAQAVAALRHPNIIAIYDFGQIGSDGVYVVMELLCGWTWREELKRMGPVSPRKLAGRAGQLLEGVKAAHDAGVVHRDLKPENIMTEPLPAGGELIKVLDFGLAKHHPGSISRPPTAIQPGAVAGTCGYMAPEQWTGAKTDQRSDVFSIGVILVEALTGRHPLLSPRSGLMFNPFLGQRIELSGSGAEVRQLETVLRRCLAAERDERFSSVEKLRSELIPVLAECPPLEPEPSGLT